MTRRSNALAPHEVRSTDPPLDTETYVPHGTGPLSRRLLAAIRSGRPLTRIAGYRIYAVDGVTVRNLVHVDFTTGGNPGRYTYVPEGEVWVERVLEPADMAASLLHELVETVLMQEAGLDYDEAHEEASVVESALRAWMTWSPGRSETTAAEAAGVAARGFEDWISGRRNGGRP